MSSSWKLCWKCETSIRRLIPILTAILMLSFCRGSDNQLLDADYNSIKLAVDVNLLSLKIRTRFREHSQEITHSSQVSPHTQEVGLNLKLDEI